MIVNEIENISDLFTRAMEGNAWHGPGLFEVLNDISAEQAASNPVKNVHSIWEIVKHLTAWHNAAWNRVNGDIATLNKKEDWPSIADKSEAAWKNSLLELKESYEMLKYEILNFPQSDLDNNIPHLDQTYYILFHGVIQHDLYHAGQISLLKKKIKPV